MNNQKMPVLKPIISVTEMAKMLNLSRARLYQLLEQGIFPQPIYDLRTHRPLYDAKLQERCLEIRNSGIGVVLPPKIGPCLMRGFPVKVS